MEVISKTSPSQRCIINIEGANKGLAPKLIEQLMMAIQQLSAETIVILVASQCGRSLPCGDVEWFSGGRS